MLSLPPWMLLYSTYEVVGMCKNIMNLTPCFWMATLVRWTKRLSISRALSSYFTVQNLGIDWEPWKKGRLLPQSRDLTCKSQVWRGKLWAVWRRWRGRRVACRTSFHRWEGDCRCIWRWRRSPSPGWGWTPSCSPSTTSSAWTACWSGRSRCLETFRKASWSTWSWGSSCRISKVYFSAIFILYLYSSTNML